MVVAKKPKPSKRAVHLDTVCRAVKRLAHADQVDALEYVLHHGAGYVLDRHPRRSARELANTIVAIAPVLSSPKDLADLAEEAAFQLFLVAHGHDMGFAERSSGAVDAGLCARRGMPLEAALRLERGAA